MSKTLSLKRVPVETTLDAAQASIGLPTYTEAQLIEMLGKIQSEKPLEPLPSHLVADKSVLPPPAERASAPVQAPAKIHGSFAINGIPVLAPGVNPATGFIQNQVVPPQKGGLISPPPTRNFR